jgi:hypothetical protein
MTAKKAATKKPASPKKHDHAHQAEPNEGEGNRTYARKFDEDERRFVQSGQVEKKAREAEEALEGSEGADLQRAEELGKSHSKGEDPDVKR